MQNLLPLCSCLFGAVLLSTAGRTEGQEGCSFSVGLAHQNGNCDFEEDQCGWNSRVSQNNQTEWDRRSYRFIDGIVNNYMSASMSGVEIGSTAYLNSTWFGATPDRKCTLHFRYYFGQKACQLSVLFENDTKIRTTTKLWSATNPTGLRKGFERSEPVILPRSECRHRVIFKAEKVGTGHCGYTGVKFHNEVDIDDIQFECQNVHSAVATTIRHESTTAITTASTTVRTTTTTTPITRETAWVTSSSAKPTSAHSTATPITTETTWITSSAKPTSAHSTTTPITTETTWITSSAEPTSAPSTGLVSSTTVVTEIQPNPSPKSHHSIDDSETHDDVDNGSNVILIAMVALVVVIVLVAVLVAVYCFKVKWYKRSTICTRNSNGDVSSPTNSGIGNERMPMGNVHTNPSFVNDQASTDYETVNDSDLYSEPNKTHRTGVSHPRFVNPNPLEAEGFQRVWVDETTPKPSHSKSGAKAVESEEDSYNTLNSDKSRVKSPSTEHPDTYDHVASATQSGGGQERGRGAVLGGSEEAEYNILSSNKPSAQSSSSRSNADAYDHVAIDSQGNGDKEREKDAALGETDQAEYHALSLNKAKVQPVSRLNADAYDHVAIDTQGDGSQKREKGVRRN